MKLENFLVLHARHRFYSQTRSGSFSAHLGPTQAVNYMNL